jgi:hypothetical protein
MNVALAALAAFWLAFANWQHPVLRLATDYANLVALWLLLLLPWGTVIVAFARLAGRARWLVLTLSIPAVLTGGEPLFLTSLGVVSTLPGTGGDGMIPVRRVALPAGGALVVYQTACVVCDYGVVVRQERRVLPGVLLVRDVYDHYHAEDASIEIVDPARVGVNGHEIRVRRWVYR